MCRCQTSFVDFLRGSVYELPKCVVHFQVHSIHFCSLPDTLNCLSVLLETTIKSPCLLRFRNGKIETAFVLLKFLLCNIIIQILVINTFKTVSPEYNPHLMYIHEADTLRVGRLSIIMYNDKLRFFRNSNSL